MTDTTHDSVPQPTQRPFTDRHTWERLVYTLLFFVAFNVAEVILWAITAIQFLFKLFTGNANEYLRGLGQSLGTFIYEVILFLTFQSEHKPFPFAPWSAGAPKQAAARKRSRATKKTDDKA